MQLTPSKKTYVTYGAIGAGFYVLLMIALYVFGLQNEKNESPYEKYFVFSSYGALLVVMLLGMRRTRSESPQQGITFGKAYRTAMMIALVYALISATYTFAHFSWINLARAQSMGQGQGQAPDRVMPLIDMFGIFILFIIVGAIGGLPLAALVRRAPKNTLPPAKPVYEYRAMPEQLWRKTISSCLLRAVGFGAICAILTITFCMFYADDKRSDFQYMLDWIIGGAIALCLGLCSREKRIWISAFSGALLFVIVAGVYLHEKWYYMYGGLDPLVAQIKGFRGYSVGFAKSAAAPWLLIGAIVTLGHLWQRRELVRFAAATIGATAVIFIMVDHYDAWAYLLYSFTGSNTYTITTGGLIRQYPAGVVPLACTAIACLNFAVGIFPFLLVIDYTRLTRIEKPPLIKPVPTV